MAVYAIAQGKVENPEMFAQYMAKVMPTIQAHQGRVLAGDEAPEVVEGSVQYARTVIVEFPSQEAFRAWYDSPEYQEILPLRLDSTKGTLIVAKGR